jgi:DNA-directed RNA polymerase subunit RPC12/RpoP
METSGATDLKCAQCGAEFFLPEVSNDVKANVSAIARTVGRVNAVIELKHRTHIGLPDAKAIAFHLSDGGACHRCGTKLNHEGAVQNCSKCRSLNLLW